MWQESSVGFFGSAFSPFLLFFWMICSPKNWFIVQEVLDLHALEFPWQGLGAVSNKGTRVGSDTECGAIESLLDELSMVKRTLWHRTLPTTPSLLLVLLQRFFSHSGLTQSQGTWPSHLGCSPHLASSSRCHRCPRMCSVPLPSLTTGRIQLMSQPWPRDLLWLMNPQGSNDLWERERSSEAAFSDLPCPPLAAKPGKMRFEDRWNIMGC